jgi:hypothetical protein
MLVVGLFIWDFSGTKSSGDTETAKNTTAPAAQNPRLTDNPSSSSLPPDIVEPVAEGPETNRSTVNLRVPLSERLKVAESGTFGSAANNLPGIVSKTELTDVQLVPEETAFTPLSSIISPPLFEVSPDSPFEMQASARIIAAPTSGVPSPDASEDNSIPEKPWKFTPSLTLSLVAAPDLNGVNNFTNSRVGLAGGLMATVGITRSLSITTGLAYAKKVYETAFSNYKPNSRYVYPVRPLSVDADCRVLDFPVNINYTVWRNNDAKIQLTGGASSYFMLEEVYHFTYTDPNARSPKSYRVKNRNKHHFGIVNLAAKYEKEINNMIGFGIQPYIKLPVTDIGYGNVRLESAGVAVKFNLNLFPPTRKP